MINKPIAEALWRKYGKDGVKISTKEQEDGSFEITEWEHPDGIKEPDETQINAAIDEHEAAVLVERDQKETKKSQLLEKLGITVDDIPILKSILKEGLL